jgi:arginyl-tRNA synthetase
MLTVIKREIAKEISPATGFDIDTATSLLEIPRELKHGHLSLPVFSLSKLKKMAPPVIAKQIAEELNKSKSEWIDKVEPVGGYVNFHLKNLKVFNVLFKSASTDSGKLGHRQDYVGKKLLIDYSSPNVAKPMHIGHLRATVIGQAIRNLAESQGYSVVGLNHLGDWGVQFGKLAWAYLKWGGEYPFDKDPFESLYSLYVRFHQEVETHPEYEKEGAATFKKLEDGDPELRALWQKFIDISMKDFDRLWQRLGVKHDLVRGESFYNDRLKDAEKLIQDKGLLVESEGAQVVDLSHLNIPPCLIRKSDGAALYATRDIASALYRMEELKADLNLYVVGSDQALHFKQVFAVLEKMGYPWVESCHHIGFGLVRFKDAGKISSRKGNIIRLSDLLDQAVSRVTKIMDEKNPDLKNKAQVAEEVAIGAVIFNDLVNDRIKNVEFDWDRALSFDGDSGPYVQYCHVRCESILNKINPKYPKELSVDLTSEEERDLIKTLMSYEQVLSDSFRHFKPNILANYLLHVCANFNRFYQKHRIIAGDESLVESRAALVFSTQKVIASGLGVLNIKSPKAM